MENCIYVTAPKSEANKILAHLLKADLVRKNLKIRYENGEVLIPVTEKNPLGVYSTRNGSFESRTLPVSPSIQIGKIMESRGSNQKVPSKYILFGDSIVFKDSRLGEWSNTLLQVTAKQFGVKSIYLDTGIGSNIKREPELKLIYGPGGDILHLEGEVKFCFDPIKVMFSPGNVNVRLAKREENFNGKVVIDMFAGIGYFSLHAGSKSKGATIYACEINPVSFLYLEKNIRFNSLQNVITPLKGDCRKIPRTIIADHIIMGHFECKNYISNALIHSKKGTVIDFHLLLDTENLKAGNLIPSKIAAQFGYTLDFLRQDIVKSYGPHLWHVVVRSVVSNTLL